MAFLNFLPVLSCSVQLLLKVTLGTRAQDTAVTSLAPCLAIPPASASRPTIKPVERLANLVYFYIVYYSYNQQCRI